MKHIAHGGRSGILWMMTYSTLILGKMGHFKIETGLSGKYHCDMQGLEVHKVEGFIPQTDTCT